MNLDPDRELEQSSATRSLADKVKAEQAASFDLKEQTNHYDIERVQVRNSVP